MKPSILNRINGALLGSAIFVSCPIFAQMPVRVTTPGTAFSLEPGGRARIENVGDARRFLGEGGAQVKLVGLLRVPPSGSGTIRKIIVHFRTSKDGPTLRAVKLFNGSAIEFERDVRLRGDYTVAERTAATDANAWDFQPLPVSSHSVVRLEVSFPQGIDSPVDPGEFVLTAVTAEFTTRSSSPGEVRHKSIGRVRVP